MWEGEGCVCKGPASVGVMSDKVVSWVVFTFKMRVQSRTVQCSDEDCSS